MLDNQLTVTFGATPVTVTRVNQDNFGSTYYGENGDEKVTLTFAHTIPPRGQPNESHLVRLNVEHYDAEGIYLRTSSAWTVIKTFDGIQDSAKSAECANALSAFLDSTIVGKLVARES